MIVPRHVWRVATALFYLNSESFPVKVLHRNGITLRKRNYKRKLKRKAPNSCANLHNKKSKYKTNKLKIILRYSIGIVSCPVIFSVKSSAANQYVHMKNKRILMSIQLFLMSG